MVAVEDLSPETVGGPFDVVLFLGVLYHAPDPLGYLRNVRRVTGDVAVIETAVDLLDVAVPTTIPQRPPRPPRPRQLIPGHPRPGSDQGAGGSGGASKRGHWVPGATGGVGPGSTVTGPPAAIESTNDRPMAG